MRKLIVLPVRVYQYAISPLMASHCRYYPTCSNYAIEAINAHGALKGLYLAIKRLLRCHPWAKEGYDPVPGVIAGTTRHIREQHNQKTCCDSRHPKPSQNAINQTTH
jgi:putative membrane protein insertion efficiency factor